MKPIELEYVCSACGVREFIVEEFEGELERVIIAQSSDVNCAILNKTIREAHVKDYRAMQKIHECHKEVGSQAPRRFGVMNLVSICESTTSDNK